MTLKEFTRDVHYKQGKPGLPAKLTVPEQPDGTAAAGVVLAHGAGGDMDSGHLPLLAAELASSGLACVRFTCRTLHLPTRVEAFKAVLRSASCWPESSWVKTWVCAGHSMGGRAASQVAYDSWQEQEQEQEQRGPQRDDQLPQPQLGGGRGEKPGQLLASKDQVAELSGQQSPGVQQQREVEGQPPEPSCDGNVDLKPQQRERRGRHARQHQLHQEVEVQQLHQRPPLKRQRKSSKGGCSDLNGMNGDVAGAAAVVPVAAAAAGEEKGGSGCDRDHTAASSNASAVETVLEPPHAMAVAVEGQRRGQRQRLGKAGGVSARTTAAAYDHSGRPETHGSHRARAVHPATCGNTSKKGGLRDAVSDGSGGDAAPAAQYAACGGGDNIPRVGGCVLLSYPLHPPDKPTQLRDDPLCRLRCPVLFVRGSRDEFSRTDLFEQVLGRMSSVRVQVHTVEGGDHGLSVPRGREVQRGHEDEAPVAALSALQEESAEVQKDGGGKGKQQRYRVEGRRQQNNKVLRRGQQAGDQHGGQEEHGEGKQQRQQQGQTVQEEALSAVARVVVSFVKDLGRH